MVNGRADARIISISRVAFCILHFALLTVLISCAPRRIQFPTDPGVPLPDFQPLHAQLAAACTGVRTLTAVFGLSGRAGDERLGGSIHAGFERPASMRLEAVALGRPLFFLAARNGMATLLLNRESRILRGASPEQVLGALTGVDLAPADLQAILTGCVLPMPRPVGGRLHADNWAAIEVETPDGPARATIYLRRDEGQWQLRGAERSGWRIEYPAWSGQFPQTVRLVSDPSAEAVAKADRPDVRVDLIASVDQLRANEDLGPDVFTIDEPPGALPITLEELRQIGPLRGE